MMKHNVVHQAAEIVAMVEATRRAKTPRRVIATLGFTGLDGVWYACYREDANGRWVRTAAYEQAIRDGLLPGTP